MKLYGLAAIMLTGAFTFSSCKDDDKEEQKKPVISSIAPSEAYVGDMVTITGENFMAEGKATKVNFGSTKVTPTENTVSFISVKVPELEPGSVNISVSCGEQVSATTTFKVLEKTVMPMEFSDFAPKKGKYQTEITISGKNFDDNVKVYINGKEQTEKTVNTEGTEIKVKLTKQTGNGNVVLKRDGEDDKEHAEELEYEFGYAVSEFAVMTGYGMGISKDGKNYISKNNNTVVEVGETGEVVETLLEYQYGFRDIFFAKDGMVYITSQYEFVLSYNPKTKEVDTVAKDDNTISPWNIIGDNDGYLYLTTGSSKKVVKVNIANKSTEIIATTEHDVTGICHYGDSLFIVTDYSLFSLHTKGGDKKYIISKADGYDFNNSGICFYPSGDMFIASRTKDIVYRLNKKHELEEIKTFDRNITNIEVDNDGNLYIVGERISKITVE